jgi:hypothetical protein
MEEQGKVMYTSQLLSILFLLAVDFGWTPLDERIFPLNGGKRFKKICGSDLVALRFVKGHSFFPAHAQNQLP